MVDFKRTDFLMSIGARQDGLDQFLVSINGYQSKEGERVGKFNRMKRLVGQQTNNNGWFRAKIQQSFFGPFPLPLVI